MVHPLGGLLWDPNLISFCLISSPRKHVYGLNLLPVFGHCFRSNLLYLRMDGWIDGWVMDGERVTKVEKNTC